ncbi:MAG: histidine kinase dimerization/phosphoacceptor domain -containing protein, partial [Desulfosarcina sp.]
SMRRRFNIVVGYAGVFLALALILTLTFMERMPLFYIQGFGPTMIRQFVIGAAIMLLLIASIYQYLLFHKSGTPFFFWYALGMVMIAEGLLGVSLGRTVGGILGWTGRLAQYTGGLFLLIAVWDTLRERSPADVIAEVFKRPGALYAAMFNNSLDGKVIAVRGGSVLSANPAASTMLGFDLTQLRQLTMEDLFDKNETEYRRFRDELAIYDETRAEVTLIAEDGVGFPAAISAAVCNDSTGRTLEILTFKDISDRKEAERELLDRDTHLKASLAEKETLLKEIHHRVKNNMQVISSLIALQANESQEPTVHEVLHEVTHRVRSMAMVHEKLYHATDLAMVDFADYTQSLLSYLWNAHANISSTIRLTTNLGPVSLAVHEAIPCGLIINELVSNALKHAFPGRSQGEVVVSLHQGPPDPVTLFVRDNGVGLPPEMDWEKSPTLGLRLIRMLSKQLQARVTVSNDGGTLFTIELGKTKS